MSEYTRITNRYNTVDLVKTIASLQLIPSNHGKYVRLETLARIAVTNFNSSTSKVSFKELKDVIRKEYPFSKD